MTIKQVAMNEKTYRKPRRFFEKSGVVDPEMSYYVPLENVVNRDKQDIQTMIDRGRYFSIFAPRQSGKTTFFEEICSQLHNDLTYVAVVLSFEQYSKGDVRDEVLSGLGRMDIMLTYKGMKYIIEIKVNRHDDVSEIIEEGILQLSGKYLATEDASEGYLVVFDTRTPVGTGNKPQVHQVKDYTITSFNISIGRPT